MNLFTAILATCLFLQTSTPTLFADTSYWDADNSQYWGAGKNWAPDGVPDHSSEEVWLVYKNYGTTNKGVGLNNIAEFGLDSDPMNGADNGKIVSEIATVSTEDYLTVTFPVRIGAVFTDPPRVPTATVSNVIYTVQGTLNLTDWTEAAVEVTPALTVGMPALSTGWEYRTFRFSQSIDTSVRSFMRVEVIEAP